jgi:hypothetical protein
MQISADRWHNTVVLLTNSIKFEIIASLVTLVSAPRYTPPWDVVVTRFGEFRVHENLLVAFGISHISQPSADI